ncbi:MAG: hypothetical protein F6J86_24555 [Symploca sp. SIO1B1]|nr:hypothetical protein [Symploca sp. SIO1C2]NER52606.1 hypothetical protein [Symploca sp. SIO1A3]NER96982.1 hypothetical protein [Symploca sp. SIO1B1]
MPSISYAAVYFPEPNFLKAEGRRQKAEGRKQGRYSQFDLRPSTFSCDGMEILGMSVLT